MLPDECSSTLVKLLKNAKDSAIPRARANNPQGLYAPLAVYIDVCTRHRFERKVLPRAKRKGWPTTIDFDRLPQRIRSHKSHLDAVLQDPTCSPFFREMRDRIRDVGLRVAESAMGQYQVFQRFQPG